MKMLNVLPVVLVGFMGSQLALAQGAPEAQQAIDDAEAEQTNALNAQSSELAKNVIANNTLYHCELYYTDTFVPIYGTNAAVQAELDAAAADLILRDTYVDPADEQMALADAGLAEARFHFDRLEFDLCIEDANAAETSYFACVGLYGLGESHDQNAIDHAGEAYTIMFQVMGLGGGGGQ